MYRRNQNLVCVTNNMYTKSGFGYMFRMICTRNRGFGYMIIILVMVIDVLGNDTTKAISVEL